MQPRHEPPRECCPQCGSERRKGVNPDFPVTVDWGRCCVVWPGRPTLHLTPSPLAFFALMVEHHPRLVRKSEAHAYLYSGARDGGADLRIFDVFLCRVRAGLRDAGWPVKIKVSWGIGWYLEIGAPQP